MTNDFLYKKSKRSRKPSFASKLKLYSDCIAGGSKCRNGSFEKNESIEYPEMKTRQSRTSYVSEDVNTNRMMIYVIECSGRQ